MIRIRDGWQCDCPPQFISLSPSHPLYDVMVRSDSKFILPFQALPILAGINRHMTISGCLDFH